MKTLLITLGLLSTTAAAEVAGPLRLVDMVSGAEVESPLLGIDPVRTLSQLREGVERKEVYRQDFEKITKRDLPRLKMAQCELSRRPQGPADNRALRYTGGGKRPYVFVLPAQPGAYYHIKRSIFTSDPDVDLRVIESRTKLRFPDQPNHPRDLADVSKKKFVRFKDLVFIHHFPSPAVDRWEQSDIHLYTTPLTRSLVIHFQDTKGVVAGEPLEAWIDDVVVEQLSPSVEQELALLKATSLAQGADPNLGIAKHGQLLPAGNADSAKAPYDANFEFRYALFAPAPTAISYQLKVPQKGRLSFSYALHKASQKGDGVVFRIVAKPRHGKEKELFTKQVRLQKTERDWRWYQHSLSLEEYAGQNIQLRLLTSQLGSTRGYGLWGNPTVDGPARDNRPNVILIGVDTLRADRLGSYGHNNKTSPAIDGLAADGVLFEQTVATSNWTCPAFATLFTGLLPSQHRVIHRATAVPGQLQTMAELFRSSGYRTHAIVYKPFLYNMGFEQGFDRWFDLPLVNSKGEAVIDKAIGFLDNNHDRRFFLFLHFNDPHQPFLQPEPYATKFANPQKWASSGIQMPVLVGTKQIVYGCPDCPSTWPPQADFRHSAHALYDGAIAYMDRQIGRLIKQLKSRDLYDNTLIVVLSDHGEILWEHSNYFGHGGPYMQDENILVPLIIKPPVSAGLAKGRRVQSQVQFVDTTPTMLQLAGLEGLGLSGSKQHGMQQQMQGKSLLPLMRSTQQAEDRVAFTENVKHHVLSVRHRGFKYVLNHRPGRALKERLYKLSQGEKTDVLSRYPKIGQQFRRQAMAYMVQNRPGRFLLVTADATTAASSNYRVEVRSSLSLRAARSFYGINLVDQRDNAQNLVFEGKAEGVILFARLDAPEGASFDIELSSPQQPQLKLKVSKPPGELSAFEESRILQPSTKPTIELFAGAPKIRLHRRHSHNAEKLKALKSLGYIQ